MHNDFVTNNSATLWDRRSCCCSLFAFSGRLSSVMSVLSGGLAKLWPLVSCDSMVPEARWKMTCRVRATRCESGNMNPSSQLKGKKIWIVSLLWSMHYQKSESYCAADKKIVRFLLHDISCNFFKIGYPVLFSANKSQTQNRLNAIKM